MSAIANETRFRRVADGNPCTFCAILATREDYRTAESAMYVVGRTKNGRKTGYLRSKGKRSIGSTFHDLCGCTVAEVLGDWEPSAKEQAYSDLYDDSVQACKDDGIPASPENITSKMRELGEGIINDPRKPETRTGSSGGGRQGPPDRRPGRLFGDDRPQRGDPNYRSSSHYPVPENGDDPIPFGPSTRPELVKPFVEHVLEAHRDPRKRSPFPTDWSDEEIMDAVDFVLAVPKHTEWSGDRLYLDGRVRGVLIRVLYRTDLGRLWTAYPPEDQSFKHWELG